MARFSARRFHRLSTHCAVPLGIPFGKFAESGPREGRAATLERHNSRHSVPVSLFLLADRLCPSLWSSVHIQFISVFSEIQETVELC